MNRTIVVVTASVSPNTTTRVSLLDPAVRLAQYQTALAEYVRQSKASGFQLLAVETSNADPDELFADVPGWNSSVWFHHAVLSPGVVSRGKGAMEWHAIAQGLAAFRDCLSPGDTIYKATGRITVVNAEDVFVPLPVDGVRLRMRIAGNLSDTRVVGASLAVWDQILLPAERWINLANDLDIEHAIAAEVHRAATLKTVNWSRFPVRPLFRGESGYNGKPYIPARTRFKAAIIRPIEHVVALAASRIGH